MTRLPATDGVATAHASMARAITRPFRTWCGSNPLALRGVRSPNEPNANEAIRRPEPWRAEQTPLGRSLELDHHLMLLFGAAELAPEGHGVAGSLVGDAVAGVVALAFERGHIWRA